MNLRNKLSVVAILTLLLAAPATPAFAVSKEIIQLQTQVQDLADRMAQMQQSFDARMGIMQNLIEHSTDNVNKLSESMQALQTGLSAAERRLPEQDRSSFRTNPEPQRLHR